MDVTLCLGSGIVAQHERSEMILYTELYFELATTADPKSVVFEITHWIYLHSPLN